jgi:hypothetical protein
MKKFILLFILLLLGISGELAAQTGIPNSYPSLMRGVRPLGMGNALIALSGTDENAMFYNPAAINDYGPHFAFRFVSPTIDFSPGAISLFKDVKNMATNINDATTSADKTRIFRDFVDQHAGQFESVGLNLPLLTMMNKWITFSLLGQNRTSMSFRNRAFTNIEIMSRTDTGGVIGTSYNFKNALGIKENVQLGVDMKMIYSLFSINSTVTTGDIINSASFSDTIPRSNSFGVGGDIGLKADVPVFGVGWLEKLAPSVGVAYQDVGNTRFQNGVPDIEQSVSVGLGFSPKIGKFQFRFDNDFRQLNQTTDFINKWNIGAEVVGPRMLGFFTPAIRVGGDQGYITGGVTLDFRFMKLEFATYGEDAGQFGREKELRRLAANVTFEMGGPYPDKAPPPPPPMDEEPIMSTPSPAVGHPGR